MRRHSLATCLIALVTTSTIVLAACSSSSSSSATGSNGKKLVSCSYRTDYLPNGFYTPIIWALQHGYYKDEGLDFKFNYGKGSVTTTQDVASGRTDAGDVGSSVAAVSVSKGAAVTSVGAFTAKFQFGFFVPNDSSIKTFKDIQGKSVVTESASPQNVLFPALFKLIGVPADSVKLVQVDAAAAISTYANGTGDAIAEAIPFGAPQIQPHRPSRVLPWADAGLVLPDYSLIVNNKLLQQHPDRVAGFLRATYKGIADAYANPQAAIDGYAAFDKSVPRDTIDQQFTAYKSFFCSDNMTKQGNPVGFQNVDDWTTGFQILTQYEGLSSTTTSDKVMTDKFFSAPYNVGGAKCPL
jgi:NitT/TauT family transport system substrate-binding protein